MATLEDDIASAAVDRAITVYERLRDRDQAKIVQARKLAVERAYALIAAGQTDVERLVVELLMLLKQREG